jgi:hypothetical protein
MIQGVKGFKGRHSYSTSVYDQYYVDINGKYFKGSNMCQHIDDHINKEQMVKTNYNGRDEVYHLDPKSDNNIKCNTVYQQNGNIPNYSGVNFDSNFNNKQNLIKPYSDINEQTVNVLPMAHYKCRSV